MSEVGPVVSQVGRFWRSSSASQRIGLAAFALICGGLLLVTATLARRPRFAVLYGNLEQEDAAQVVDRLRELKAPYRVTPGGTIEAPAERVDELRLELAGKGLPAGGQAGFELFDRARFGLSDFGEKINYQRALEGELARTIAHLDSVEQARVHVAIPQERLYQNQEEKATASVVVKLRGNQEPTRTQVRSVVHLVAGAVGGLSADSVTVLDTRGRLLSSQEDAGMGGGGVAAASSQFELRRAYERQVEDAVQSMLDGVIGPGKAVVRVSADMSFERVETESETYQPAGDGKGVLESRRETKENYRGTGAPGALGIPGVSSNTGTAMAAQKTQSSSDQYEHSEVTDQYRVSRQLERRLQPPGEIRRLSLSVLVDEKADLGKAEDLKGVVAAAAGLDTKRADEVVITRIPFQPLPEGEKGVQVSAVRDFYFTVGRDFGAIVLMLLFLRFVHGLLRRRVVVAAPSAPGPPAPAAGPAVGTPQDISHAPSEGAFDPERAASVVREWLSAEPEPESAGGDGRTEGVTPAA